MSEEGARRTALAMAQVLAQEGYAIRDEYWYGYLPQGEVYVMETTLVAGLSYVLVAGGCEDAIDVDLYLYDENEVLIDQDEDVSKAAVVRVAPAWTGKFYVVVKMYRSAPGGAHWALLTGFY